MSTRQPFTSGSRLKVISIAGGDGTRLQLGLFDTQRGEPCQFRPVDRRYICLPGSVGRKYVDIGAVSGRHFSDASCSRLLGNGVILAPSVIALDAGFSIGQGYAFTGNLTAAGITNVYPIEGQLPPDAGVFEKRPDGSCVPTTPLSTALLALGPEIPLTEFVSGVEVIEP